MKYTILLHMHLAIVGGRDFNDYVKFKEIVKNFIDEYGKPTKIISGGARGVDTLAEQYAKENNIEMIVFKPDWSKGKVAGLLRNTDIINACTHVLALPTDKSVGTYDSIKKGENLGKVVMVVKV